MAEKITDEQVRITDYDPAWDSLPEQLPASDREDDYRDDFPRDID
jgi:hypothetical protein